MIFILILLVLVFFSKIALIRKDNYNNVFIFSFMSFELVALIPALWSYNLGNLNDSTAISIDPNLASVFQYVITYLAIQTVILFITSRMKIDINNYSYVKFSVKLLLYYAFIKAFQVWLYQSEVVIFTGLAILANTPLLFFLAFIAISLSQSALPLPTIFICLCLLGFGEQFILLLLGIANDFSRLGAAAPFLLYTLILASSGKFKRSTLLLMSILLIIINEKFSIIGGGDYLIVKNGINISHAISENLIDPYPFRFLYNIGFQFILPIFELGRENFNSSAFYLKEFYGLSDIEIGGAWGVGVTLVGDLILAFGHVASIVIALFVAFFVYILLTTKKNLLRNRWAYPILLGYSLKLFAALRMDSTQAFGTLIFDLIVVLLLLSSAMRVIK